MVDRMKKDVEVVRDIDDIKVATEDTRGKILSLLKINNMTISQIADNLEKDHSTIYRHVKKLEKAGYIEEVGEEGESHMPKKVYGRTANVFLLLPSGSERGTPSELMLQWEKKQTENIIDILDVMGYQVDEPELVEKKLTDLFIELKNRTIEPIEDAEEEIGEISFPLLLRLEILMFLMEQDRDEELRKSFDDIVSKIKETEQR